MHCKFHTANLNESIEATDIFESKVSVAMLIIHLQFHGVKLLTQVTASIPQKCEWNPQAQDRRGPINDVDPPLW